MSSQNLTYLEKNLPFLSIIDDLGPTIVGIITGLLPTVLLAVLMALLPVVLRLFAKLSGIPTTDGIDRYVQGSYFVFQVVHAFLFVSISSSVASILPGVIENPSSAAKLLAANIPTASNFFLSFLALQGLSTAGGVLLQIGALVLFYLMGKLFDNTPRKKWERQSTLTTLTWGTIFPIFTNFVVITVVYAIIAPLMLFISGIAFGLFYIAYIYTLFNVSKFSNTHGGLIFSKAIYQSFTGIYLMEIILAALFFLAQSAHSAVVEGILMCVLIGITIIVHSIMRSSFDPLTYYLPIDAEEFSQIEPSISEALPPVQTASRVLNASETTDSGRAVINITSDEIDAYHNTKEDAYIHPAMQNFKPIIWIAQDNLGISAEEIQQATASGLNIVMSSEGARFDEKLNIEVSGPPPDHMDPTERNGV